MQDRTNDDASSERGATGSKASEFASPSRRAFLATTGAVSAASLVGCLGSGGSEDSSEEPLEAEFKERLENFVEFLEMFDRFTKALLPYINKKNLTFLKHLVKLAEAHQSLKGEADSVSAKNK
mgnify:CR=1 FL=1